MGEKYQKRFEVTIKDSETGETKIGHVDQLIFCGLEVESENEVSSTHFISGEYQQLCKGFTQLGSVIDGQFRQQNNTEEE